MYIYAHVTPHIHAYVYICIHIYLYLYMHATLAQALPHTHTHPLTAYFSAQHVGTSAHGCTYMHSYIHTSHRSCHSFSLSAYGSAPCGSHSLCKRPAADASFLPRECASCASACSMRSNLRFACNVNVCVYMHTYIYNDREARLTGNKMQSRSSLVAHTPTTFMAPSYFLLTAQTAHTCVVCYCKEPTRNQQGFRSRSFKVLF